MSETRKCKLCGGTGQERCKGYVKDNGEVVPDYTEPCYCCRGTGQFEAPNEAEITAEIKGRKGLRSKKPRSLRGYYVWRMVRFNAGLDVTLPMVAMYTLTADPWTDELDRLADKLAVQWYGRCHAGAARWSGLIGEPARRRSDDPPTAFEGGPVTMVEKPPEETTELM